MLRNGDEANDANDGSIFQKVCGMETGNTSGSMMMSFTAAIILIILK